jgi:hypothetical protein
MNGNGWLKPVIIGVAVLVLGAAIVGSASNTFSNSVTQRGLEVSLESVRKHVDEQRLAVAKIPVMDERIKDIKEDVKKILEALDRINK